MIDIPLSEIPLELTTLSETWVSTLSIDTGRPDWTWLSSDPSWRCAVNYEHKLIFTQLTSDVHLMRDFYYEYLLAIGDKIIIISWDSGEAHINNVEAYQEFDINELKELINRCAELTTYNHERFSWKK